MAETDQASMLYSEHADVVAFDDPRSRVDSLLVDSATKGEFQSQMDSLHSDAALREDHGSRIRSFWIDVILPGMKLSVWDGAVEHPAVSFVWSGTVEKPTVVEVVR